MQDKFDYEDTNIDRLVNSVGTNTFINYFYEFKSLTKNELFQLFSNHGENWKASSKEQKAINGKRIFIQKRELEALEHIILKKNRNNIPNGTFIKQKAKSIYKEYNLAEESIMESSQVSIIEKRILTKYRLQQSKFRRDLLIHWEGCSITGCENSKLLIASHIKPYSESNDIEKYDINNGLLLTPTFDKLFDKLMISFDSNGKILISKSLNKNDLKSINITGNEKLNMPKLTESTMKYLEYHRNKFILIEQQNF